MEEAFFDTPLYREFAQLQELSRLADGSTILRFRHRLEKHKLAGPILATVNEVLVERGLLLKVGTVVDATLIAAPSSSKNKTARLPQCLDQLLACCHADFSRCDVLLPPDHPAGNKLREATGQHEYHSDESMRSWGRFGRKHQTYSKSIPVISSRDRTPRTKARFQSHSGRKHWSDPTQLRPPRQP